MADRFAVAYRDRLHRIRRPGPAGHEETYRVLLDRAHGFRDTGRVPGVLYHGGYRLGQGCHQRPGWRRGADDLAWPDLRRAVPVCRGDVRPAAHPRYQRLWRRGQRDAKVRRSDGAVRACELRLAWYLGVCWGVP